MPRLTIHTATYNRAYILSKAYESLKSQTVKDFEWVISDDGSTDNTEDLVLVLPFILSSTLIFSSSVTFPSPWQIGQ